MKKLYKSVLFFIYCGFSLYRYKRYNSKMKIKHDINNLFCLDCGKKYKYPEREIKLNLVDEVSAISFCCRKCKNKGLKRIGKLK